MGGWGERSGRGAVCTSWNETNVPRYDATSCVHKVLIASRYSFEIAPRRVNGTPSASNSCLAQPTPTPKMKRPPLNRSTVAAMRAVRSGLRYGMMMTVVPSSTRRVAAASQPSVVNGS